MNTLPPGHAAFLATHLSLLLSEKTNSIDWPQRPFTDVHKQRGKTQPFRNSNETSVSSACEYNWKEQLKM